MVPLTPKQANSLSDILYLAENPPQYPARPHENKHDPLVLYISRIPGSRDVILSPVKPAERHIRLQDVLGSLYYVHLHLDSDQVQSPLAPQRSDETSSPKESGGFAKVIPRKPLPENARSITPESAFSSKINLAVPQQGNRQRGASLTSQDGRPPFSSPSLDSDSAQPVSGLELGQQQQPYLHGVQAPLTRKAVGPRAIFPSVEVPVSLPTATGSRSRSHSAADVMPARDVRNSYAGSTPALRKPAAVSTVAREPYVLTLIRRDPTTGTQRTVATITSQRPEPSAHQGVQSPGLLKASPSPDPSSASCPPISIYIENLGYAKFRRMPKRHSTTAAGLAALATDAAADNAFLAQPETGIFSRQLQMSYSKSLVTNLKDKLHRLEEQMSKKGHSRDSSDSSRESVKEAVIGQPQPGMKPRGYTFTSPWDDRCDFRTSLCDRSVRCYQAPPRDAPTSFNARQAEQGNNRCKLSFPSSSALPEPLSELRFNLPNTELFINTDPDDGHDKLMKFCRFSGRSMRHDGSDDDDDENDDDYKGISPLLPDVGEELAGGGIHGDRAKLGKLIIHHDGLKMLDLLVAANVGVWWSAWERSVS